MLKEKTNILDLSGCVYWIIKHFIDLKFVFQGLYSSAEVQFSRRDTFCLRLDFRTAWRSAALQHDELSVLAKYCC